MTNLETMVEKLSSLMNDFRANPASDMMQSILAKKGELTSILREAGSLSPEDRVILFSKAEEVRKEIFNTQGGSN